VVGAEIVEQIQFPYPVAPIVRSHHEKWNGTGYPDGLAGEQIPIGARILSAVDCLDALASDRQYRRALPLDEAIKVVESESGKSFDPRVVEILVRRYVELEHRATSGNHALKAKFSTAMKIERGDAPAAGFETAASNHSTQDLVNFQHSIEQAEKQSRLVAGLTQALKGGQDRDTVLATLRVSLKSVVPYDAMVVYLRNGELLVPAGSDGEHYRLLASVEIPLGKGLSGWVADTGKSILNGNPSVEPGYLKDPTKFSTLGSALAVPLETKNGIIGVLSLYREGRDAFRTEELTSLLACGPALADALDLTVEHAEAGLRNI
jgi:putative methionine-R-sulfoxide reductase with GAF domain